MVETEVLEAAKAVYESMTSRNWEDMHPEDQEYFIELAYEFRKVF